MDNKFLKELGQRVVKCRKSMGATQENIAEQLDVSVQMVSNLECGKKTIRLQNLIKLSEIFDVSIDYLLTGTHINQDYTELVNKMSKLNNRDFLLIKNLIEYCIENRV